MTRPVSRTGTRRKRTTFVPPPSQRPPRVASGESAAFTISCEPDRREALNSNRPTGIRRGRRAASGEKALAVNSAAGEWNCILWLADSITSIQVSGKGEHT